MLYLPKIDDYLKILTDEEVKKFVVINYSEYFKPITEEQNLKKIPRFLYIFLIQFKTITTSNIFLILFGIKRICSLLSIIFRH